MSLIDIRIMGVPSRIDNIRKTQSILEIPDDHIFIDEKRMGCVANAKRAWALPTNKDFVLLLQDDIELCTDFLSYCNKIVNAHPEAVISLFCLNLTSRRSVTGELPTKSPYVSIPWVSGQGIILNAKDVKPCLESWDPNGKNDDMQVEKWAKANGKTILTTIPCIIQHIGYQSVYDPRRVLGGSDFYCKNPYYIDFTNPYVTNVTNLKR